MKPLRSFFFFDRRDYALLKMVNEMLSGKRSFTHAREQFYPFFHPHGIKELAESKGLRIAYAVIHLLNLLEIGKVDDRLAALRSVKNEVIGATGGPLPLNTARVLLQLMKELVRAHGNYQKQLELAHDFRRAASGKPGFIRRLLKKNHLLEMPEEYNQIAFDDHVHDANTKGRKSASHLIMDAWIKGIRRLRIIYYNYISARNASELMAAAEIMGITVRIGIEFSARFRNRYIQLIWVPRGFSDLQSFLIFLAEPEVTAFMAETMKVSKYREKYVLEILEAYNKKHRLHLNNEFGLNLAPVTKKNFLLFVGTGQASLLHLARFIHERIKEQLPQKIAELKKTFEKTDDETIKQAVMIESEALNNLDSETILECYLRYSQNPEIPNPSIPSDDSDAPTFLNLTPKELIERLLTLHTGYRITLNLSHLNVVDVLEILYDCNGWITRLEIFNLKDFAAGKVEHIPDIVSLQQAINQGNVISLKAMIRKLIEALYNETPPDMDRIHKLTAILHDIASLKSFYDASPIKSRIGSDSTGRSSRAHGMGLVIEESLPRRTQKQLRHLTEGRRRIPIHMTILPAILYLPQKSRSWWHTLTNQTRNRWKLQKIGLLRQLEWQVKEETIQIAQPGNIITLGGIHAKKEHDFPLLPASSSKKEQGVSWHYLNNFLKNSLKVVIGFVPAFATFYLTKDWWVLAYLGAFIWFGITGLRNILQSVMGGGGLRKSPLLHWNDLVSWERTADSLLFTGFSVPLLDYFTKSLILDTGFNINTSTQPILLYTLMAITNGIYLSSHNALRGLPKTAVIGNFFRSILSIPIAIGLNAIIGHLLLSAGVASVALILQKWAAIISKTASDMVAAFIEGYADRLQNIQMRRQDYERKFSQMFDTYSELELLFPERPVLEQLEASDYEKTMIKSDAEDLERIIIICSLDMLYLWMYQPRARSAFKQMLREISYEERNTLLRAQFILQRQREISLMLINGILGKNFSRPLSFYLQHYSSYLKTLHHFCRQFKSKKSDKDPENFLESFQSENKAAEKDKPKKIK